MEMSSKHIQTLSGGLFIFQCNEFILLFLQLQCTLIIIDPFNKDIICGRTLWKQSLFMTYHRCTTNF